MGSGGPKVLREVAGRAMLLRVLDALASMEEPPDPAVLVVGRGADEVRRVVEAEGGWPFAVRFALQRRRLGTGHALRQAAPPAAGRAAAVLVLYGDVPLIQPGTLDALVRRHQLERPTLTLLTALVEDPSGYGRVLRRPGPAPADDPLGDGVDPILAVVEERAATPEQRRVREVNAGVYVFDDGWLWPALASLAPSAAGEIYLTDLVSAALRARRAVAAVRAADAGEALGVNTPEDLQRADEMARLLALEPAAPHGAVPQAGRDRG